MPKPALSPAQSGIMPVLRRRAIPFLAVLTLLFVVAASVLNLSDAEADLVFGSNDAPEPYTVSLVSQAVSQETGSGETLSVADVAEASNAAVVTVYTFVDGGAFDRELPTLDPERERLPKEASSDESTPLGAGSGWILTEDGYVVTNAHVVQGADSYVVQSRDGTQIEAELIGTDAFQDVAVLKLALESGATVPGVSKVGDSSTLRPGDEVVAIGSPLGEFTNSVSNGHIGGLDRSLDVGNGTSLDNLIQHDAEISPGNSGGPLLNMLGEVIGMNVAKVETAGANGASATGLNFAIDGDTVVETAETIIATNDSIAFPYLGVQTQLTDQGTVVVVVEPDSPAAKAGLEEGDVVARLGDVALDDENGLMSLLFRYEPGDTVTMSVLRDDAEVELDVTLGTRPDGI